MHVYGEEPSNIRARVEVSERVGVAESAVSTAGQTLSTSGVGSCLAVALLDVETSTVALGHPMLPRFDDHASPNRQKFVDTTVDDLLARLDETGARTGEVEAIIVGGAEMFDFSIPSANSTRGTSRSVGVRNVETAHRRLDEHGVEMKAERTGGSTGRSVELDSETGQMTVRIASDDDDEVI